MINRPSTPTTMLRLLRCLKPLQISGAVKALEPSFPETGEPLLKRTGEAGRPPSALSFCDSHLALSFSANAVAFWTLGPWTA